MPLLKCQLNGQKVEEEVPANMRLVDFIREQKKLTGTHVGCDSVQCGACTILKDGKSVKSCALLAHQCQGSELTTVEGLGDFQKDIFHPVQTAFQNSHALQCGFCTPGMINATVALLDRYKNNHEALTDEVIRHELDSNLCRCTGYQNIVLAVKEAKKSVFETE